MKLTSKFNDLKDMSPADKKEMMIIALLILFFAGLAMYSMNNFITLLNFSGSAANVETEIKPPAGTSKEAANIEDIEPKYRDYLKSRTNSRQLATLAEAVGRYPIANASEEFAARSLVEVDVLEDVPEIIPTIAIKALVIMSGEGVAALDIEGERPGLIVSRGTVFGGGKGKIMSIDAGGVSWKWADKKYRTDL